MDKHLVINQFTKSLMQQKPRKNEVTPRKINNTLINAAVNCAFVNESCKSSGQVSKSQVIYRKLDPYTLTDIQDQFRKVTVIFLRCLKIFSRNHRLLISLDTTKEAFYGDQSKAENKLYLHEGSIAKESYFYYEFLTASITCNDGTKYILDGRILRVGDNIPSIVSDIVKFIKQHISESVFMFDRGFTDWHLIAKLKDINAKYIIFWRKHGSWYIKHFEELKANEFKIITRTGEYNCNKTDFTVSSKFVLIKGYEYDEQTFDWIFATNLHKTSASSYIKRYKKRWGIETIYRVTDNIRIYTTSTKALIRYFLFMFTCLVYNIWKFFQQILGEGFTLSNFKTNMLIYMAKRGWIYPIHYNCFESIADECML